MEHDRHYTTPGAQRQWLRQGNLGTDALFTQSRP